ncbi:hypothetical protein [Streptomyces sp. VNUA24]|uniref:hypothetical protein n=1 Tax=Streptomyces sp. VNUA24 TaxID=3031131 RepID=UPI0023B7E1CF|nr:hypothetical protein [Streptomyces sp. VNUA24]WEH17334.1 hypothetical protein PYR72_28040 [Streptomyces sp. VNUA24]
MSFPASVRLARRPLRGVAVLGLVVVTAGCAADTTTRRPPAREQAAAEAAPAPSAEARELVLPFDTYKMSKADDYLVAAAEDVLMGDCLRAKGMGWTARPPVKAAETDPPNRRRYGVIEDAVAREFGFHAPPDPVAEVRFTSALERRAEALTAGERRAAYGDDGTGGCWRQAHDRLLRGVPASDYGVLNRRALRAFEDSRRDPRVRAVFREWSACMAKDGFRYADPPAAVNDPRWGASTAPSAREIATARADVRCKEETGVVPVWRAAETRIQRAAIAEAPTDFQALKATRQAHLTAARATLREHS